MYQIGLLKQDSVFQIWNVDATLYTFNLYSNMTAWHAHPTSTCFPIVEWRTDLENQRIMKTAWALCW